ncbi:lysozyme [Aestuariibius insulae]|uniref:lysozyme n=1 Tax=Aestuariibius insulae TaxID=2058287 RepID=UPI00345EDF4B
MELTFRTATEVAFHEGLVRQAYKDSVGVWTWSVGLTSQTGHNVRRYIDNPQPLRRCLEVFAWALDNYAEAVRAEFKGHDLTEAQFAAALSFHWNTGSIRSASWPDHWKAGKIAQARESFMLWNKPAEIIERREAEADLFFDGIWAGDGTMTEYTRLTARHTPVWSSAQRITIEPILRALLGDPADIMPGEISLSDREKLDAIREIVAT